MSNYENVPYGDLRSVVDPAFLALQDQLSEAYYDYWRYGVSRPVVGYNKQSTVEESKALYDKLIGLLWHFYEVALAEANADRDEPYDLVIGDGTVPRLAKSLTQLQTLEGEDNVAYLRIRSQIIALGYQLANT